ncbi:glycoside hydrolase family 44 protein [Vibrio quintilis]|uniref:Beta-mannanase/endoglucanase A n=1 Tax=Vibrio quintilis TaxID=1117707 RepID=A0A1M7YUL9_9VIBR|nr:glycoside hydrolase family 44 protein [Vibrio quintilis]SHO56364.1 Beta-mannanase/endoglucanase A precursor [Vibrio quintilis]
MNGPCRLRLLAKPSALSLLISATLMSAGAYAQISVDYSISPDEQNHTISDLIYGTNHRMKMTGKENFGFYRLGGNRTTGYNWENNYSNAGEDWKHSSDTYMVPDGADETVPGITLTDFIDNDVITGAKAMITLQMAGYVSADKNGTVEEGEVAPSSRWIPVVAKKAGDFSLTPDLTDNAVYMDEMVNFLVKRYGKAEDGGVFAYSLDNEPALWSHTHPRIHPEQVKAKELVERSVEMASAVKDVDPSAKIFGPALYGFSAYVSLQSASDWSDYSDTYHWFIDYYLAQMKAAQAESGKRLLDVLDLHWYSSATGDTGITSSDATSDKDKVARMQAPRTLWDSDYKETSWITQWNYSELPLIPHIQKSVDTYYPDTKIAFTEYSHGGGDDISGGIAEADTLGIFGKYDIYAANSWILNNADDYLASAYRLYRNYDGDNSTFGDTSVTATMSDKENSSVYASVDSETGDLHVIVLNKNMSDAISGSFTIDSTKTYKSGQAYAMTSASTDIKKVGAVDISNNQLQYDIPALSAYHFILSKSDSNGGGEDEGVTATVDIPQNGNSSYCTNVVVTNNGTEAVDWKVSVEIEGTVSNLWNATWTQEGTTLTLEGVEWNKTLQPGKSTNSIGFCATR